MKNIFIKRRLIKNIIIIFAFFVLLVLISSSSISVKIYQIKELRNFGLEVNKEELSLNKALTGLAPRIHKEKQIFKTAVDNKNELEEKITSITSPLGETMWGYNAYCPSIEEGPVYFDIDNPGDITLLQSTMTGDFMSGGTWTSDERWICCEYGSGVLWEIDPEYGDMTSIGGGGQPMNGLSWDPINNQMYGVGNTCDLFKVDYETGETELVGSGGISDTLIALAFDIDGNCYSWDIKFSGDSYLYSVDIESGALTTIGSMGKTLCYAQDGDYLFSEDRLILTAYIYDPEYGGYLCEVDKDTGELEILGEFEGSAEIDASMFQNIHWIIPQDVGIKNINYPEDSSDAVPYIKMQVLAKNYAVNHETTDINMHVIKYEDGPIILEEDFSGTFPPEGWTTDWWKQSYTNLAGGDPPEARCYKYDQYNGSYDYYDNYIQSPPIDCTGIEKINLKFRWAADVYYNNYCSVYLKYQKNQTAPWKDVTPWDNPIPSDMEGDYWEVSCYGYGESLGDNFSFKFDYIGYYYYFNYWWLDDVTIKSFSYSEEYNETIEQVEISPGSEVIVDFPPWTPSNWQDPDYENRWQDYQVKACTLLDDDNPKNDCKQKIIELYFAWMHDIEITSIDSPSKDGPGKTYPVKATIKNVGQYPECCIPINISIGESVVLDTLLSEESWDTVPPSGWTDEHKNYLSYYGWDKSNTSYSGGLLPEARLPYYYALADYVMYSYAINTTVFPCLKINFKSYINHYSGQGLYTLKAGYSYDKETWYTLWSESPEDNEHYNVSAKFECGPVKTYIGFWVQGDPWYMNYWYLDDIIVKGVDILEEEYIDNMCQGPDLEPGETRTFEFDDWTPEYLQYETTGSKDYTVQAEIEMVGDNNPDNDITSEVFTLDYWHDVAINVTSSDLHSEPDAWLGFCDDDVANALGSCGTFQYAIRLTPDELTPWGGASITTVKRYHGYTTDFSMNGKVKIYGQGTPTHPGELITVEPFSCYEAYWHEIPLDNPVFIADDEDIWVSIEVYYSSGQYPAAMDSNNNYPTKGDWISMGDTGEIWNEVSLYGFYTDWLIRAGVEKSGGAPSINTYIKPGTQNIKANATNLGTFPELDLTCYAEIYEYITNCSNGTLVYEDNITEIDLDTPLGGTELLNFDDYNFEKEGPYGLFLNMTDENDDYTNNNEFKFGIGVDNTPPESTYCLDPPTPDGDHGWYISDAEVTLTASDPLVLRISSGIKEIKYKIGNGSTQIINGDHGSFVVDIDEKNLSIEYWAVDNVGNEEKPHNTFIISIDQTYPDIDIIYEFSGNYIEGWDFVFTATATDETSGMNRVEFFLNDLIQDAIYGPGPTYKWAFKYSGDLNIIVKAIGYDKAGNFASDEIVDPENIDYSQQQLKSTKETQVISKSLIKILYNLEI